MHHTMHLLNSYFEKVKSTEKLYEIRLNDEKRKEISKGDIILFKDLSSPFDSIEVKVNGTQVFPTFANLLKSIPLKLIGFENVSKEEALKQIYTIYTPEQEEKYGVLLIRISPYVRPLMQQK